MRQTTEDAVHLGGNGVGVQVFQVQIQTARQLASKEPGELPPRAFWQPFYYTASLAFVYAIWTIIGSGAQTVFYGFVLMLLGLPVYVWMRREQSTTRATAQSAE